MECNLLSCFTVHSYYWTPRKPQSRHVSAIYRSPQKSCPTQAALDSAVSQDAMAAVLCMAWELVHVRSLLAGSGAVKEEGLCNRVWDLETKLDEQSAVR